MSANDNDFLTRDSSRFIPFDTLDESSDAFMSKIEGININYKTYDLKKIENAYRFAYNAHEKQRRKSGELYIMHPVSVSIILAKLNQDTVTICAALLHDVIEDTKYEYDDIKQIFGAEIANVVDGVTKVSGAEKEVLKEQYMAETYRKMILATSKNPRTIMVKLVDRLHNLSTLETLRPERQKAIATETLEIYAPIAAEIGAYVLKTKLEDISMMYVFPEDYDIICRHTDAKSEVNNRIMENFREKINSALSADFADECVVSCRLKGIYSIYRKHIDREVPYEEIFDIIGCRIVCKEESDCYKILGILHKVWKPMFDKIKDYIAVPKDNGYKSIHTTLVDSETGRHVEVQIRTWVMDIEADYGFSAHGIYKDNSKKIKWLNEFPLWEKEFADTSEFMSLLKSNIATSEITVYTKEGGNVVKLPDGAVVLDLAYYLSVEKGNKCCGAIVDGKLESIYRKLLNNETVSLLTSTDTKPNVEWLSRVRTPKAKAAIKERIRKLEMDDKTNTAFSLLLNAYDYVKDKISFDEYKKEILSYFGFYDEKALYEKICSGEMTIDNILTFTGNITKDPAFGGGTFADMIVSNHKRYRVIVNSLKNSGTIRSAVCCNPIPGERIIGFRISGDRGISVHRENCANALFFADDTDRVVFCDWADGVNAGVFLEDIVIIGIDKERFLLNVMEFFDRRKIKCANVDFSRKSGSVKLLLSVEVRNVKELSDLLKEAKRIKGVSSVVRNLALNRIR
ncbi:MAG: RelA/SpoT family protein [Chitinispirillales bacterium]|nr:RelA/SpoT family protein [Chitinispirillales bacterium]